ncbi:hypothetical protein PLCT2_02706 [Planctomycetaceae bacterium]|nr:hypothetical protein PLCT2_02706 [Planctomycetaceae bacterium]
MSNEVIIGALGPVLQRLKSVDLSTPQAAREALGREFGPDSTPIKHLRNLGEIGLREGWLCDKGAPGSKFSRVAKPEKAMGFSIDAVLLSAEGPWHKHTKGEVNYCIAIDGEPKFCGIEPGWAVFAPGSEHVPSVSGGTMLIFYLLPQGAVEWKK